MEDISDRTQAINGIVFKTQILSFNASIEATRAGAHGKGFSVVALEVGRLADLSGKASEEIGRIVSESRRRVREVVEGIAKGMEKTSVVTESSREQIQGLLENVETISERVTQVRSGAQEQSAGIDEIVKGMAELSRASGLASELSQRSREISDKTAGCASDIASSFRMSSAILFGRKISSSPKAISQSNSIVANASATPQSHGNSAPERTDGSSQDSTKLASLAERIIARNTRGSSSGIDSSDSSDSGSHGQEVAPSADTYVSKSRESA